MLIRERHGNPSRPGGALTDLSIMRLLLIIGPAAVGKMTVGREIGVAAASGCSTTTTPSNLWSRSSGTAPFHVLNGEFR